MLASHLETLPADPNALLFTAPGGGNGRADGDGGPVRHGLFVRRVFKRAVKGDPDNKDSRKRRPPALPAAKHSLRWHDLRDTCASLLIHNGASILLVSKRLGHAAPSMTLDRYGWLYPSAEAALTVALDATYNGAENVTAIRQGDVEAA
jgi:integrase